MSRHNEIDREPRVAPAMRGKARNEYAITCVLFYSIIRYCKCFLGENGLLVSFSIADRQDSKPILGNLKELKGTINDNVTTSAHRYRDRFAIYTFQTPS